MTTTQSVGPNDPRHPNYARYRTLCAQIVYVRSAGLPDELTARDRRILARLATQRDALWGSTAGSRSTRTQAPAPAGKKSPKRRKKTKATTRQRQTESPRSADRMRAAASGRRLAPRIHYRCERCRKECWTSGGPKKFCEKCSNKFRGRTAESSTAKNRLWLTFIPSGHPGSGVRHG